MKVLLFIFIFVNHFAFSNDMGKQLAQDNGCLACHSVKIKILGPSYQDIAKKYKNDKKSKAMLIQKIKNGGTGNWGNIPMPGHPRIKNEDLDKIVTWILSI